MSLPSLTEQAVVSGQMSRIGAKGSKEKSMTSISYDRTDVFISYSHKDAQYMERLKTHFDFDERKGSLSVWADTEISPGSQWRVEIEKAIKKTRIAILLVSA